jgi:P4 family phage/plasmid primase-like protien
MIAYSLEKLDRSFPPAPNPISEKLPQPATITLVEVPGLVTKILDRSVLNHLIREDAWATLKFTCVPFNALLERQTTIGVDYSEYFLVVTMFAQIRRPDLAHKFARLHPNYALNYEETESGFPATQKIIDGLYHSYDIGNGPTGYITYEVLNLCHDSCKHRDADRKTSPVRHLIVPEMDVMGEVKPKKITRISDLVEIINSLIDILYSDKEERFYVYENPIWSPRTDDSVRAIIYDALSGLENVSPDTAISRPRAVFEALKLTNLNTNLDCSHQDDRVVFKNAILHLDRLANSSVPRDTLANLHARDLKADLFNAMKSNDIKKLHLVGTLGAQLRPEFFNTFDPSVEMPLFTQYLESTFKGHEDLIPMAQEIMGYCMQSGYPLHVFFLFIGPGGNGKGVFVNLIRLLLGDTNTTNMNFANFGRFSSSNMQHKLANISDELPRSGADWDLLKNLSGGGHTDAERKHKPTFSFRSTAKLMLLTNDYPTFQDPSNAFWTRIKILQFNNSFREMPTEIHKLEEVLHSEIDAIAFWALEGLVRLFIRGRFDSTISCQVAIAKARTQTDSVRGFIEDRCELSPNCEVYSDNLFFAYRAYCAAANLKPFGSPNFSGRLKGLGVEKSRQGATASPRRNIYTGITYNFAAGHQELSQMRKSSMDDIYWVGETPLSNENNGKRNSTASGFPVLVDSNYDDDTMFTTM